MTTPTTPTALLSAWLGLPDGIAPRLDPQEAGKGLILQFPSSLERNRFFADHDPSQQIWKVRARALGFHSCTLAAPGTRALTAPLYW